MLPIYCYAFMNTFTAALRLPSLLSPQPKIGVLLTNAMNIETGSKNYILNEFESDGKYLSDSIRDWLDQEYAHQDIHKLIGERVGTLYIQIRAMGVSNYDQLLPNLRTSLELLDMNCTIVTARDIVNKVSDLLICNAAQDSGASSKRLSILAPLASEGNASKFPVATLFGGFSSDRVPRETLEEAYNYCAQSSITPSKASIMKETLDSFRSTFNRFIFLREFLEGEQTWEAMQMAAELLLGHRPVVTVLSDKEETLSVKFFASYAPYGWEGVTEPPDLSDCGDGQLDQRLAADLPEEDKALDMVIESIVGNEGFQMLKIEAASDVDLARRLLVVKWMYVNGFLADEFPSTLRFVPGHVRLED